MPSTMGCRIGAATQASGEERKSHAASSHGRQAGPSRKPKAFSVAVSVRVRPVLCKAEAVRVASVATLGSSPGTRRRGRSLTSRGAGHRDDAGEGMPIHLVGTAESCMRDQIVVGGPPGGNKCFKCFSRVVGPDTDQAEAQELVMPGFLDAFMDG